MEDNPLQNKRGLKNRKPISNNIDIQLAEQLDRLSAVTRIDKSKLLDEAIQMLIDKYQHLLEPPAT